MMRWVPTKIRRVIIFIAPVIKTMVNREEEEYLDKDPEEVVLEEPISSVVKKGIELMNVCNTKEGQIK